MATFQRFLTTTVLAMVGCLAPAFCDGIRIEYIAHSSFVLESPGGTRIVIDPFNGTAAHGWLGYGFPKGIEADAVLVTHPHYDHDATYNVSGSPAVFRAPGSYSVKDVRIWGIEGRHADPETHGGVDLNTIWIVETAGVRAVHLGDNGPLSRKAVEQIGQVDILMMPIDGDQHILRYDDVDEILKHLHPRIIVPMHFELPSLSVGTPGLGPIDPWLANRNNVRRLATGGTTTSAAELPESTTVMVFSPSPSVQRLPSGYAVARAKWAESSRIFRDRPNAVEGLLREAVKAYPTGLEFWFTLAGNLMINGKTEEAIRTLERGLAVAGRDDWVLVWRARSRLAMLYEKVGEGALAATQYRIVYEESLVKELRNEAKKRLSVLE